MAKFKKVLKADFFRIDVPSGRLLDDLVKEAAAKGICKDATVEVSPDSFVRLEKNGEWAGTKCIEGDMVRLRMNLIPEKGGFDTPLETLGLPPNVGTGEASAFIYDKTTQVLLLEANRSAVSASAFASYFRNLFALDGGVNLEPVPQPDILKKVMHAPIVRRLEVKLAGPINPGSIMKEENISVRDMLKLRKDIIAPVATFTFGVSGRKESLPRQLALATATRLLALRGSEDVPVEKIKISGVSEEKESFAIDLLDYRVHDEEKVETTRDRVIPYERRQKALRIIWNRHEKELTKHYKGKSK